MAILRGKGKELDFSGTHSWTNPVDLQENTWVLEVAGGSFVEACTKSKFLLVSTIDVYHIVGKSLEPGSCVSPTCTYKFLVKITKLVLLATPGPWVVPPSSQGSWWKLLGISLVLCHSKLFKHILESWPIKLPLLGDILPFHVPFPSGGRASRASRSSADSEQQRHRASEERWDSDGLSHDLQNTTIFGYLNMDGGGIKSPWKYPKISYIHENGWKW